jgi:hypothetical protein
LPFTQKWVLNLDADHRLTPELRTELKSRFQQGAPTEVQGFLICRRTIFLGKWIRFGGHYPVFHAALFQRQAGQCEDRLYDQHFHVSGNLEKLNGAIEDILTDSLTRFIERHNRWASLEAECQTKSRVNNPERQIQPNFWGNPQQRRRYFKRRYEQLPRLLRPFLYFFFRYIICLGFLDGRRGLIFHLLQGFWFRFLIDAKIIERRCNGYSGS